MNIIFDDNKPKYISLYEQIANKIHNKELEPNSKLPSKRDLAIELNISLNTVINAYDILANEGYIYTIPKKGYYVSNLPHTISSDNKSHEIIESIQEDYLYDFTTSNKLREPNSSLKKIMKEVIEYSDYINKRSFSGDKLLKEEIVNHLINNRGIYCNQSDIVITSGIEGLESILRIINVKTLCLENPGYHKLKNIAENNNYSVKYLPLDNDGVIPPNEQAILYTTPFSQFPTGIKMSIQRKLELIENAKKYDGYIIEDDFDAEFKINSNSTKSLYSINNERVIFTSSFSSSIFPGLRIAYYILPITIKESFINHYKSYSSSVPTIMQLALREYIKQGYYARSINKIKKEYLEKRNIIINYFKNNDDVYIDSKKNYASVLIKINKQIDDNKLKYIAKNNGIKLQMISDFDKNKISSGIIVLGYTAIKKEDILNGLDVLSRIIKEC